MATDAAPEHRFISVPPAAATALAALPEPARLWFTRRFGLPTPVQRLAWPALAQGSYLLLAAPTGSGKTLAAFLPHLAELLAAPAPGLSCVYVAPLKALVADARRNLRRARNDLCEFYPGFAGILRIAARTGDTSPAARRRLRLQPPQVLLTTPESLAVLLAQATAVELFRHVRQVVVDEVHALADSKRGADLALSLERLDDLAEQPVQRIGLSATCTPLTVAASFLAGSGRTCTIAAAPEHLPLELTVTHLQETATPGATGPRFVRRLVEHLEPTLLANRTTLVFTNTRALAERLVWALKRHYPHWTGQIGIHHSAVARQRRRRVEKRLKQGRLRVVVSSTSLELGVDVGFVDGVVLVHPPGGVVRLLQRVGRAGHAPGRPRRGLVLAATPAELLETVATAAAGRSTQFEPLRVPEHPLDVLCQQVLGLAAQRPWAPDDAFALVRRAFPYRNLSRRDFDDCLDYLSGWTQDGVQRVPPRLAWHDGHFMLADRRTARVLLRNIGTIVAEETRPVCTPGTEDERVPVGQVEEAFADRLRPGDRFLLDGRCLEFQRAEQQALLVHEVMGRPAVPRWQGNGWPLSAELAQRIYLLRTRAAEALRDGPDALAALWRLDYGLADDACSALVDFFQRQECVSEVPTPTTCLVEQVPTDDGCDHYVHTPLNRAGNDALARVAVHRLARQRGRTVLSLVADLGFLLVVPGPTLTPDGLRDLLALPGFDADLEAELADSLTLRERFRCTALTGLMLLRNPLGRRRRVGGRDWAERQLFERVRELDPDFVLLRQARRDVFSEALDLAAAQQYAALLPRRDIRCRRLAAVSPFAEHWSNAQPGPLATVDGPSDALLRLHGELMVHHP